MCVFYRDTGWLHVSLILCVCVSYRDTVTITYISFSTISNISGCFYTHHCFGIVTENEDNVLNFKHTKHPRLFQPKTGSVLD